HRRPPAGIGEDLPVPTEREAFRRKDEALLLVDGNARHHDQRAVKKDRYQQENDTAQRCSAHAHSSCCEPNISVRPTSANDISTRNTAMAAANGIFDW